MKIAILTANLGNFDTPIDPVKQILPNGWVGDFHRFTDENFPPITGLTPRFQYRIPKLFGWEMFPEYDAYIWLDGTFSFTRSDCVEWFIQQLGDADAAFFKHPARNSIQEEVDHIEDHLQRGKPYIVSRYKNGLHKEFMTTVKKENPEYKDNTLLTSTAFIYRNNQVVNEMMYQWWLLQSRYFTCDQIQLPYAIYMTDTKIHKIDEDQYKIPYLSLISHHK
jgi:hypothetical protein